MLKKIIHGLSRHHHPWRNMQFDELAEIYTSMTMRNLAFSLVGIFVPVYLYTKGVSIQGVLLFFVYFFVLRIPLSFVVGKIIGRIGPKHTIAVSNIINIAFLSMLLSYDSIGWPLGFMAFMYTLSNGLFFTAYHTDFSKVQHKEHGGKELGWLFIFERFGAAIGPVIGGVVATVFIPEATVALAMIMFVVSLIPLFMSNEPVRTHQKINYRKLNHRKYARNNIALSALNVQNVAHGALWPLLIAVFIFTDDVYAKLGFIVGISMAVSMFSARMYGAFIDGKKGFYVLRYGATMNTLLLVSYSFITSGSGAFVASALGEPVRLAYKMPLVKGFYDEADSIEGQRIAYFVWAEVWVACVKSLYAIAILAATYLYDPVDVLRSQFIVVAAISLIMLTQKYPALKKV